MDRKQRPDYGHIGIENIIEDHGKCVVGCLQFMGGEVSHHKDCVYHQYPLDLGGIIMDRDKQDIAWAKRQLEGGHWVYRKDSAWIMYMTKEKLIFRIRKSKRGRKDQLKYARKWKISQDDFFAEDYRREG